MHLKETGDKHTQRWSSFFTDVSVNIHSARMAVMMVWCYLYALPYNKYKVAVIIICVCVCVTYLKPGETVAQLPDLSHMQYGSREDRQLLKNRQQTDTKTVSDGGHRQHPSCISTRELNCEVERCRKKSQIVNLLTALQRWNVFEFVVTICIKQRYFLKKVQFVRKLNFEFLSPTTPQKLTLCQLSSQKRQCLMSEEF